MMNEATRQFVLAHREEDVQRLALGNRKAEVDMPMALQQIAGWQTARKKLPSWAALDDIVYPPHLNMEQCSSEQTAKCKASLTKGEGCLVDLTGGFGVDFYWMSQAFKHRVYVERNAELCDIARHNFQVLGLEAEVVNHDGVEYLQQMDSADVVFLDPARRDQHGSRTYGIEDCTPNVIELLPLLKEKARRIILKLSPMLDWRKAVSDLAGVSEVLIVSVANECKELLLVIDKEQSDHIRLCCINDESVFTIATTLGENDSHLGNNRFSAWEQNILRRAKRPSRLPSLGNNNGLFLFEPNASIMKAGCFREIEESFAVRQLAPNSHLFLSAEDVPDFPGRRFSVESVSSMNKQELKSTLQGIERANIAVRNFPLGAEALRKKLKIKDGGDVFIFGTTLSDDAHQLFICRKIG